MFKSSGENMNLVVETPYPQRYRVLFATVMCNLFTSFTLSSINVAAPAIQRGLGLTAPQIGWVVLSFTLAAAAAIAPAARLADIWGRKRTIIAGLAVFLGASFFCALARNPVTLIGGRIMMGLGMALVSTSTMALVGSVFPTSQRGKAFGYNISAVYLGLSLGPVLGGLLSDALGWPSIFWLPALGLAVPLTALIMVKDEWRAGQGESFDRLGAVLWAASLTAVFWGLTHLPGVLGWLMVTSGVALGLIFIVWQLKTKQPILNVRLLKNLRFTLANLAAFINYSAITGAIFLLSLYLQYLKGLSAKEAGLYLMLQPVIQSLLSPFMGRLADRVDPGTLASLGMAFIIAALGLLSFGLRGDVSNSYFFFSQAVFGLGFALFIAPNTTAIMGAVEPRNLGQASGLLAASRLSGQMCSLSLVTLALTLFVGPGDISPAQYPQLLEAIHFCFYIFIGAGGLGLLSSMARAGKRRQPGGGRSNGNGPEGKPSGG